MKTTAMNIINTDPIRCPAGSVTLEHHNLIIVRSIMHKVHQIYRKKQKENEDEAIGMVDGHGMFTCKGTCI